MMKPFFVFIFLICLVFPCFSQNSQNSSADRFSALSEAMGRTIESGKTNLENYDDDTMAGENARTYANYRRRHESLASAMKDSESRMDLMVRTNERPSRLKDERDHYEELIGNLESTKKDYDNWLRNVK